MSLAMPTVYFPMVTPMRSELETRNGQNIVVPVDGEMTDSSWPTLTEGTSVTVGSYAMDSFSVVVQEAGRGLAVERLVKQYLVNGMHPGEAQNFVGKLMRNFALSWENQLRGLWLAGKFRIVSAAAGSSSSLQNDLAGTVRRRSVPLRGELEYAEGSHQRARFRFPGDAESESGRPGDDLPGDR
jgi:hypothetical protein